MVDREVEISSQLEAFGHDPQAVMNQKLPKFDGRSGQKTDAPTAFSSADIAEQRFVEQRDQVRKKACTERGGQLIGLDQILPGRAAYKGNDLAENLVDKLSTQMLRTLEEIEAAKLTSATLKNSPWSDSYWPLYQGVLGARYADPKTPGNSDWKERRQYTESRTLLGVVRDANQAEVDTLSPAEKYDLLIGHASAPLTEAMWSQGRSYFERDGNVELWMGICHGWAPASFMLPRPTKIVTLPSADARFKLRFFPADLKALGSLLWAVTRTPTRFIGGRCNDKNPKTEPSGRVISDFCFDTNPGTWHLSVVNQLGAAQRSMIMDATFDYEVWNQPLLGYSYTYFNPVTRKVAPTLKDAMVACSAYAADPFKAHRSKLTENLVGIAMDVVYIAETLPSHTEDDSPARDRHIAVRYMYDLELDAEGRIIGGEWYTNKHPDFLWTPGPDTKPMTLADSSATGPWTTQVGLPESWRDAALIAAQNGQPLAKIVTELFNLAK